jgi:hypothetical protein
VHGASEKGVVSRAATTSMADVAKELDVPWSIIRRMINTPPGEVEWLSLAGQSRRRQARAIKTCALAGRRIRRLPHKATPQPVARPLKPTRLSSRLDHRSRHIAFFPPVTLRPPQGAAAMSDRSHELPQDQDLRNLVRVVSACTLGLWAFAAGLLIGVYLYS